MTHTPGIQWMPLRTATRLLCLAGTLLLAVVVHAPSASAAPITVAECPGSNWAPPVGATTLTDAQQSQILNGNSLIVYDSYGGTIDSLPDPLNDPYPPACVARASNGQIVTEWAYCTDRWAHVCLDQILPTVTGNPRLAPNVDPLGPEKERVIAYLVQHGYPVQKDTAFQMSPGVHFANSDSAEERTSLQQLIWCVSEAPPGEKVVSTDVRPGDPFGTDTCANNFADADFDAVLALAPGAPTISVAPQSAGPLPAGQQARFVVTSNVLGIPITVSGTPGLTVCDGAATLVGDQLTIPGNDGFETKQVTLCAPAGAASSTASIVLRVQHPSPTSLSWAWGGSTSCQVFATFHDEPPAVRTAAASVRFADAPQQPAEQPKQTEPTVTASRGRMSLTKTSNRATVKAGQQVRYRIRVRNAGKTTLRNVRVCDTLPAGLTRIRTSRKPSTSRGRTCWTVKQLAPGRSATFTLTARVARGTTKTRLTNRVTATTRDASSRTAKRTVRVIRTKIKAGGVTG